MITTDGMENASCRYSYGQIKKMIQNEQKKYGWQFIFIGANIDSYAEAQRFGIKKERAVNYMHDSVGTANLYAGVSKAVCSVMMAGSAMYAEEELNCCEWDADIREDYRYNELFAVIFMGHLKRDNCIIKRRHKNTHPKRRENSCMGRAFGFVTIGIPAEILMTMLLMMPLVVR